jgi:transglutaminase-like putative cysteine protease
MTGGYERVQAICDFVHSQIRFSYPDARPTRCASDSMREGIGVCRDFAHLAIALCRCMNIPARYCTGYLGDIGVPVDINPMDFSAWFEVFLDGRWYTMDARHNHPALAASSWDTVVTQRTSPSPPPSASPNSYVLRW